jgi:hypothetical protein
MDAQSNFRNAVTLQYLDDGQGPNEPFNTNLQPKHELHAIYPINWLSNQLRNKFTNKTNKERNKKCTNNEPIDGQATCRQRTFSSERTWIASRLLVIPVAALYGFLSLKRMPARNPNYTAADGPTGAIIYMNLK